MHKRQGRDIYDPVAELYDRYRPAYPDELVEDVLSNSGIGSDGRALEVGCGTGQATRQFARHGFEITCVEPSQGMLAVARRNLRECPNVRFIQDTFEDAPLEPASFELVYSAQAFHWVRPDIGYLKAGQALRPGGSLALFWNLRDREGEDADLRAALDSVYQAHAPDLRSPSPGHYGDEEAIRGSLAETGLFGELEVRRYPWSRTLSIDDWVSLLNTGSDHVALPDDRRDALLSAVREALRRYGDSIEDRRVATLFFARKKGG
ncbi:MAG: class I SAM-dependent methyltransferase [Chloroflexota bacterium]